MNRNEKGLSGLPVLLLIVVLVVLGGIGWRVFKANNKPAETENSNAQPAASTQSDKSTGTTVALPSLSLEFIPTTSVADVTVTSGSNEEGTEYIAFSSPKLKDMEQNTFCDVLANKDTPYHLGLLFKVNGTYPSEATDENSYGRLVKQYNDYNLQYRKPADTCFEDSKNQTLSNQLMEDLFTSISNTISEN